MNECDQPCDALRDELGRLKAAGKRVRDLDRESGLITEHRVSHLLINDQPVRPEQGVFRALAEISPVDPESVPVFFGADAQPQLLRDLTRMEFQTRNPFDRQATSLFSIPNKQSMRLPTESSIHTDSHVPYDCDPLQRKNDSRKKFGILTPTPPSTSEGPTMPSSTTVPP